MSAHDMHADHHGDNDIHVTTGGYVTGFILAVILTVIPFWLVMGDVIQDRATAAMVLGLFAIVQVVVHMYFFLHMNGKIEGGWTMMSTIFAVVFVAITLAGTLWVMFHMNTNMMPEHKEIPSLNQPAPAPVVEVAPVLEAPAVAEEAAPAAEAVAPEAAAPAETAVHSGHSN
jgi:cytochrome o ubiquinol oxidase subunit IV